MSRYGLLARFSGPEALSEAARRLRERGYRRIDAFSPFPVPGLAAALGMRGTRLQWAALAGGLLGATATYALILYSVVIDYPINVGGRALNAWPAYLVLAFEGGILGAALATFFGMLVGNRLPEYHHPVFNARTFSHAAGGGFFLLVEAADPRFRAEETQALLAALGAEHVEEVAP